MAFDVATPVYEGPFDLLLHLILKEQVDIYEVSLARIVDDGRVENVYRIQIMNSAEETQKYQLKVRGLPGIMIAGPTAFELDPAEARWITVSAQIPFEAAQQVGNGMHSIQFDVERLAHDDKTHSVQVEEKSTFMVPR